MRRIAVIGSGGAGKSTLARALGDILDIDAVHLDRLYWQPGWTPMAATDWEATQRSLVQRDRWILDGNYGGTLDLRLAAADTVIFLDLPRTTCIAGVLWRWLRHRRRSRPDGPAGCPDRITRDFLRWIWRYPCIQRPTVLTRLAHYAEGRDIVILRSRAEVRAFLADVRSGRGSTNQSTDDRRPLAPQQSPITEPYPTAARSQPWRGFVG